MTAYRMIKHISTQNDTPELLKAKKYIPVPPCLAHSNWKETLILNTCNIRRYHVNLLLKLSPYCLKHSYPVVKQRQRSDEGTLCNAGHNSFHRCPPAHYR